MTEGKQNGSERQIRKMQNKTNDQKMTKYQKRKYTDKNFSLDKQ